MPLGCFTTSSEFLLEQFRGKRDTIGAGGRGEQAAQSGSRSRREGLAKILSGFWYRLTGSVEGATFTQRCSSTAEGFEVH